MDSLNTIGNYYEFVKLLWIRSITTMNSLNTIGNDNEFVGLQWIRSIPTPAQVVQEVNAAFTGNYNEIREITMNSLNTNYQIAQYHRKLLWIRSMSTINSLNTTGNYYVFAEYQPPNRWFRKWTRLLPETTTNSWWNSRAKASRTPLLRLSSRLTRGKYSYLTERIYSSVLDSHLLHKMIYLLFTITN